MGLGQINRLQSDSMRNEDKGLGYSGYAKLGFFEKRALTRIDAINTAISAGLLSDKDKTRFESQKKRILNSRSWKSAARKLADNAQVVEYAKNNFS